MKMTKHDDTTASVRVLDGNQRMVAMHEFVQMNIVDALIAEYDATMHVGLRTVIYGAAIERKEPDGEITIEVPRVSELRAAVAIARCLIGVRLRGWEMKAMRKILGYTLAEFAKKMDERTAPETISRWESESQPMGGYAEKMLRLLVCEELADQAPGVEYNARMISNLRVIDPWTIDPNYEVPVIGMRMIELKEQSGTIIEAYNVRKAA